MPKNADVFGCEICNFKCSKKSNYNKHLLTAKHKKFTEFTEKFTEKNAEFNSKYICDICDKHYTSRMGLWKHKQKCSVGDFADMDEFEQDQKTENTSSTVAAMMELIKQNQEFKELIVEQNKQLIELAQKPTMMTNNNQTIHNNQKFNLNVFLNEQCKDAINMSEFLENMTLDIEDLEETGRLGYVGGISRIFVNKLRELDTYKRPLHCTDMKREILYIRENDEWSKETNSKEKLQYFVNKVANKNCKTMRQWTEEHPDYTIMDSPENQEFVKLTDAILGGLGDHECKQFRDKIVRNVIKEVMINKI
jgi:hypothetical protein|uniref:C2H2-type domain-containing protein n=1 Tax=viral metagenome TaxID=1070528 RepID=A0A6C0IK79_9ZZZZ